MPPRRSKRSASAAGTKAQASTDADPVPKKAKSTKVTLKAGSNVPVIEKFHSPDSYHVYSENGLIYSFTGNQTNIANNNNKFYRLQLLESDKGGHFVTFGYWGRVGGNGQSKSFADTTDLKIAKKEFEAKFRDKTKNHWSPTIFDDFEFVKGKYDLVKIDYNADDDDDDDAPAPAAKKAKSKAKSTKVTLKAGANVPVIEVFHSPDSYHVYSENGLIYSFTGNQTNIANNNNKFYRLQLLESDKGGHFVTFGYWGRVGGRGQNMSFADTTDLNLAKKEFEKKFRDKTKNQWSPTIFDDFEFVKGKYDLVKIDYNADGGDDDADMPDADDNDDDDEPVESQLKPEVKSLMELIFDVKKMNAAVVEMEYDLERMPLGKLTKDQILAGYQTLKDIEALIEGGASRAELTDASSEFYTRIPHAFGMRRPPVIATLEQVQAKLKLVEALDDIKAAMKLIQTKQTAREPAEDRHYRQLDCKLEPLDKKSTEFKMLNKYLKNTHGASHRQYKMELLDAFEVDKDTNFEGGENRKLLWHGSRLTNWGGILSQGLRIAPPEAPVTGYMFGKGVYFADASSKSANYCMTSRSNNVGLLLLCEVALNDTDERMNADSMLPRGLKKGCDSILGKGRNVPDPAQDIVMDDGLVIPAGTLKDTKLTNPNGYTLQYNEYIVYRTSQIKFRYLLKCKFNY
eukprot:TRINITY_DN12596_c0_g1_i2.p1 TRINITY_DN12596_c0_g1~~TRINITY_DN12596_c0_g1_i2.p1  ORF type:complete len:684 (+),score=225.95 TRINITY_DN12596_c0_g1_i2:67-2118(+)